MIRISCDLQCNHCGMIIPIPGEIISEKSYDNPIEGEFRLPEGWQRVQLLDYIADYCPWCWYNKSFSKVATTKH